MARILLVEDNEMNRDMLSRRLERRGFEVAIAVDGRQGIDMAKAGGYDLVLMDMSLPEVDGWEATRQLRAAPETRRPSEDTSDGLALFQAPRAGFEPATNRLHLVPPFPTGVDYLITMDRGAACRWRALVGRLFFRHSLVSAPSLRPFFSEGLAQDYPMPVSSAARRLP